MTEEYYWQGAQNMLKIPGGYQSLDLEACVWLEQYLAKYPSICTESVSSFQDISALQNQVDLTTTLPTLYAHLKNNLVASKHDVTALVKEACESQLSAALVVIATVSACQMVGRACATEAQNFHKVLDKIGVKLQTLPASVKAAVEALIAVAPEGDEGADGAEGA